MRRRPAIGRRCNVRPKRSVFIGIGIGRTSLYTLWPNEGESIILHPMTYYLLSIYQYSLYMHTPMGEKTA